MGQRICSFLVVLLLMFSGQILGQKALISKEQPPTGLKSELGYFFCRPDLKIICSQELSLVYFEKNAHPSRPAGQLWVSNRVISPAHYANNLGFVCKAELKLDKMTVLPFRFRLGSLEYVNWLERKPNAIFSR